MMLKLPSPVLCSTSRGTLLFSADACVWLLGMAWCACYSRALPMPGTAGRGAFVFLPPQPRLLCWTRLPAELFLAVATEPAPIERLYLPRTCCRVHAVIRRATRSQGDRLARLPPPTTATGTACACASLFTPTAGRTPTCAIAAPGAPRMLSRARGACYVYEDLGTEGSPANTAPPVHMLGSRVFPADPAHTHVDNSEKAGLMVHHEPGSIGAHVHVKRPRMKSTSTANKHEGRRGLAGHLGASTFHGVVSVGMGCRVQRTVEHLTSGGPFAETALPEQGRRLGGLFTDALNNLPSKYKARENAPVPRMGCWTT